MTWMTYNTDLKVTVLFNVIIIIPKWYKIQLYMYNDRPTVVAHNLSNGAIFNDFDQALTHTSRSWHYLTLSVLRHYNSILIGLTQPTQRELFWVTLSTMSDFMQYSMTRSMERSLCDSRASYMFLSLQMSASLFSSPLALNESRIATCYTRV